jgi:ABC-type amino acid transport substrate-binding protein
MSNLRRRTVLHAAAAATAALAVAPLRARAATDLVLLVGGPEGGLIDGWSTLLAAPIGRALGTDAGLRRVLSGGLDGVTAANQLEAQAVPDGDIAALLPGATGLAWLIGDQRVHYEPTSWTPLLASLTPSVIALRRAPGGTAPPARPRVALPAAGAPELAALLALSLLGLDPQPVWTAAEDARAALATGKVDALLLRGRHLPDQLAALPPDVRPLCSLAEDGALASANIPDVADVHLALRGAAPAGPEWNALRALAIAGRLEAVLILPGMTPAARVAQWRQASTDATTNLGLQQVALDAGAQLLGPDAATSAITTLAIDSAAQDEIHHYIGRLRPA